MSQKKVFVTAGLIIKAATGEIHQQKSAEQSLLRLSPINKRVLLTLLENAGQVVSRHELFKHVWPNQEISDDALTRAISDLRHQLKGIANTEVLIETIPKTGYRWKPPSQETQSEYTYSQPSATRLTQFKPMVIGLVISLLLIGLFFWFLTWWSKPDVTPLVVLPVQYTESKPEVHSDVTVLLKAITQEYEHMQYLSQYAYEAHQGNPFPYFNHEYGVRWFIESRVHKDPESTSLTLNLIDAKTALVIYSVTDSIENEENMKLMCQSFIKFIASL